MLLRGRRPSWQGWRRWRRGRPFWGGLATVAAGAWICVLPLAPLKIMLQQGVAGIPSVLMGIVMIVLGLTAWFAPQQRTLAGVLTALIATAALVLSNLGGFLIGTLLGILGGGLIFAWQPYAASRAPYATPRSPRAPDATEATDPTAPRDPIPARDATADPTRSPTPHHDSQGVQP